MNSWIKIFFSLPDLRFVKKFTRPNFWAENFTHKKCLNCDYFCEAIPNVQIIFAKQHAIRCLATRHVQCMVVIVQQYWYHHIVFKIVLILSGRFWIIPKSQDGFETIQNVLIQASKQLSNCPEILRIIQPVLKPTEFFWNHPEISKQLWNHSEMFPNIWTVLNFFCISRKYSGDFETIEKVYKTSSPDSFETIERVYKKTSSPDSFENCS